MLEAEGGSARRDREILLKATVSSTVSQGINDQACMNSSSLPCFLFVTPRDGDNGSLFELREETPDQRLKPIHQIYLGL
jgi:hypothetical protein